MKIPNISCKIEMSCSVNPSEDPSKIMKSISNIFPNSEIKTENFSVSAHSKNLNSLEKFMKQFILKNLKKPIHEILKII